MFIGTNISYLCNEILKIGVNDLASKLGIAANTLYGYIEAPEKMRADTIEKLCSEVPLDVADFFNTDLAAVAWLPEQGKVAGNKPLTQLRHEATILTKEVELLHAERGILQQLNQLQKDRLGL